MKILSFALSSPPAKKMTKPLTSTIPATPTIKHKLTVCKLKWEWLRNLFEVLHKAQTIQICFYGCI